MILFFFANGIAVDCRADQQHTLIDQLSFYILGSSVTLRPALPDHCLVVAFWGDETSWSPDSSSCGQLLPDDSSSDRPSWVRFSRDPRLPALGWRGIHFHPAFSAATPFTTATSDYTKYQRHRLGNGVPEGGVDFPFGTLFPHEANMDRLNGISIKKGCYIGQEIVARAHYRGTVRKRIALISWTGPEPEPGTTITAGKHPVGTVQSTYPDGCGFALLHCERTLTAMTAHVPLMAGTTSILPTLSPQDLPGGKAGSTIPG